MRKLFFLLDFNSNLTYNKHPFSSSCKRCPKVTVTGPSWDLVVKLFLSVHSVNSSTVRLLEKKGLLFRVPYEKDIRANSISNTEKGKSCLQQAVFQIFM